MTGFWRAREPRFLPPFLAPGGAVFAGGGAFGV